MYLHNMIFVESNSVPYIEINVWLVRDFKRTLVNISHEIKIYSTLFIPLYCELVPNFCRIGTYTL